MTFNHTFGPGTYNHSHYDVRLRRCVHLKCRDNELHFFPSFPAYVSTTPIEFRLVAVPFTWCHYQEALSHSQMMQRWLSTKCMKSNSQSHWGKASPWGSWCKVDWNLLWPHTSLIVNFMPHLQMQHVTQTRSPSMSRVLMGHATSRQVSVGKALKCISMRAWFSTPCTRKSSWTMCSAFCFFSLGSMLKDRTQIGVISTHTRRERRLSHKLDRLCLMHMYCYK